MGCDKAFLEFDGKTLLENAFEILQRIESRKISVVIAEDNEKFANFPTVTDIYKNRGVLSGIHAAVYNCQEKFAVILASDFPFVSEDLLKFLVEIAENENADCIAPIQKDGIIQPLCAVYQTRICLQILIEILENYEQTSSAQDFLKRMNTNFIEFEKFKHLPNAENFFLNINSPKDMKQARNIVDER